MSIYGDSPFYCVSSDVYISGISVGWTYTTFIIALPQLWPSAIKIDNFPDF